MSLEEKNIYISRKSFLKGLAGLSMFPFLEINAAAKAKSKFKRMVFIACPFGMVPEKFKPKDTGSNYTLSTTLKPLEKLKKHFTVISNLEHINAKSGHEGVHAYLSGVLKSQAKAFPTYNQTIDQLAAQHVGSLSRFPSLNLGFGGGTNLSWNNKGSAIRPMSNMKKVFSSLFVNNSEIQKKEQREIILKKRNLLSILNQRYEGLSKKLSAADKYKIEEFKIAISDLEGKIAMDSHWLDKSKPNVKYKVPESYGFSNAFPSALQLIFLALQTNSTRVASIDLGAKFELASLNVTGGYHDNSHHGKKADKLANLAKIENFFMVSLAEFIKKLASTVDPEGGGSMLENTMVLFGSGMSNGASHSCSDLPLILAGGDFKHGQHIRYEKPTEMTNLLFTMGQKFGLPIDKFNTSNGTLDL